MKTISLRLTEGMDQKLSVIARTQRTTKSNLLRMAITAFLDNEKNGRPSSCLDLAGDLIGCVNAPADLSTNRAHMKGFGE